MKGSWLTAALSAGLLVAVGWAAWLTIGGAIGRYNARIKVQSQSATLEAYDKLLCGLICKRTIAEANALLGSDLVKPVRSRKSLGHLQTDGIQIDLCLKDNVIVGVDSSHSVAEWPPCLQAAWELDR